MKILSLGLDNSILDKNSALVRRVIEYGEMTDQYLVIVPSPEKSKAELSGKTIAYGSGGGNKLQQLIRVYRLASELCRRDKYDVITVQDQYYLALIGLLLAKKFKLGLEVQVHGFEKFFGWRKLLAGYVLPRADAVRCVSQRLKKILINDFNVSGEKITVVPIYSESRITNHKSRIKNNKNNFIFLTVGRLVPVKNIGLQIEAMAEVAKKYPQAELWIVGDGPERLNYESRIKHYELEKNIKILGWQNDLAGYYNSADAFVLTSLSEGWGLAVVEAAGFGLPIIMTDVGLAGEVIENGKSGLVIPVDDQDKLIEAMIKIIEDQALRVRLGDAARLAIEKLPDQPQILSLYKKSWERALKHL